MQYVREHDWMDFPLCLIGSANLQMSQGAGQSHPVLVGHAESRRNSVHTVHTINSIPLEAVTYSLPHGFTEFLFSTYYFLGFFPPIELWRFFCFLLFLFIYLFLLLAYLFVLLLLCFLWLLVVIWWLLLFIFWIWSSCSNQQGMFW